jgi:hypothetical protein
MVMDEDLENDFRTYKRTASRLRDLVVESDAEDLTLTFELRAERDKTARARFTSGSQVARLAALLRPFMVKDSAIELRSVWQRLLATGEVKTETRTSVEQAFADAERLSLHMKLNDRELSAREVYFAYGEGRYFAEDGEARERLAELSMGPMQALLPMLFHDACANYSDLVFVVLEAILELEKAHPEAFVESDDDGHQCIYCGKGEGDFNAEEHVIPESLAGDEVVLKGSVCSTCNNVLSQLDQVLLDFEPLAMLRTIHGPMTKKGKFQRARLRDFDMEKVAPREIRVTYRTGTPVPKPPEPEPDGTVRFSIQGKGRSPFTPVPLARALFKIGLGLIAWQAGPDAALDPRYDRARQFVLTGGFFPNHLVMSTTAKPNAQVSTFWQPTEQETIVVLQFYGLTFVFNLQATQFGIPPDLPIEGAAEWWLGETDEKQAESSSQ